MIPNRSPQAAIIADRALGSPIGGVRLDEAADLPPGGGGGGTAPRRAPPPPAVRAHERRYLKWCRRTDIAVPIVVLILAFVTSNLDRLPRGLDDFLALRLTVKNLLLIIGFAVSSRAVFWAFGLYDWRRVRSPRVEAHRVLAACGCVALGSLVFPLISVTGAFHLTTVGYFWLGASASVAFARRVLRQAYLSVSKVKRDIVIVGSGPRALRACESLQADSSASYNVLGFIDSELAGIPQHVAERLLGTVDGLESVLMQSAVDEVVIALPVRSRYADIQQVLHTCERVGVRAKYLADVFQSSHILEPGAQQFLAAEAGVRAAGAELAIKRAMDIMGGLLGLVCAAPILIVAAAAIKFTSAGPVFFVQPRHGLNRRLFQMYKLRTMIIGAEDLQPTLEGRNEASGPVFKIQDDPRVTAAGRWLRRFSIDELPQFFNVVRGDMSLVGPRPLPQRDVQRFTEAALLRRFSVRPGLTCLWQISGRSNLDFGRWIALDLKYIDEWSLALDWRILTKTLPVVVKGTGAA